MAQLPLTPHRWTRAGYERLVELGAFRGEAVELLGGQLIVAEPQSSYHATAVGTVDDALRAALPPGWIVRAQMPIGLADDSAPEPDIAVAPGARTDYRDAHPAHPVLVVEVAESSLDFDRRDKGSLYARGGIRDYWIVNLVDRVLEVYRDPRPDDAAAYGWSYGAVELLRPPATVTPLAFPSSRISVADLLA
jgi:Uma2 family endonuclease